MAVEYQPKYRREKAIAFLARTLAARPETDLTGLPRQDTADFYQAELDKKSPQEIDNAVDRAFDSAALTPRYRQLVITRYGLETGTSRTADGASNDFGVSGARIRQLDEKYGRRLRRSDVREGLQSYLNLPAETPAEYVERVLQPMRDVFDAAALNFR